MDLALHEIRCRPGVEENLLQAYYELEAARNPGIPACRRLVAPTIPSAGVVVANKH
ncbi:MAG: hypothetical protein ABI162_06140 [Luteolibacter sp.]